MVLKNDSKGELVKLVQTKLQENGYSLTVDGIYGSGTEKIVKAYQQNQGLEIDGMVGRRTFRHLVGIEMSKYLNYETGGDYIGNASQGLEVVEYEGSKRVWLLDNGHGGLINGVYQTSGKRSPQVPPGVYEGDVNRKIVKRITEYCDENTISYCNLVPENEDISLKERIHRAHKVAGNYPNSIYVSVHCNAFGDTWNNANGIETYFYKDDTAEYIATYFQKALIQETNRNNRGVKEANFYVLRNTKIPAILTECGFMTNLEEARLLANPSFIDKVAEAHVIGMMSYENSLT